ncbi:MAG: aspartate 1-decarboxylase, partial [Oxalobacter sp.]|nr:aspartate 1-decarboxylase [Oxalobacter sp.]
SGILCLNGAAARMAQVGDTVILMAYALMSPEEARENQARVVFVDSMNHPVRCAYYEKHGALK